MQTYKAENGHEHSVYPYKGLAAIGDKEINYLANYYFFGIVNTIVYTESIYRSATFKE